MISTCVLQNFAAESWLEKLANPTGCSIAHTNLMGIYITRNNEQFGPLEREQVLAGLNEKRFFHTDLAWQDGMTGWQPLSVLFPQRFETAGGPPPPPPPQTFTPYRNTSYANVSNPMTSELAIVSLITGLSGFFWGPLSGIPAVITGHLARRKINASMGRLRGSGMALTGLIFGYFTTVLPVIVCVLIVLPALPKFMLASTRSKATRTFEDLRLLDSAMDQYAIENNKPDGTRVTKDDLRHYLKRGTSLYNTMADCYGHKYGPFVLGELPKVPAETFQTLSAVADASFWSPYY